ncbi:MAG: hypothetical protein IJ736_03110 [Firmicutes bacterium]|nr:hypothetical protein [Bacillota bacterium]
MDDNKRKALELAGTVLGSTALMTTSAYAEDSSLTAENYDTQLLNEFKTAGTKITTVIIGVIGVAMGIIVIKQIFKAAVSFFKSASTK